MSLNIHARVFFVFFLSIQICLLIRTSAHCTRGAQCHHLLLRLMVAVDRVVDERVPFLADFFGVLEDSLEGVFGTAE